jgi:hypothetical protein
MDDLQFVRERLEATPLSELAPLLDGSGVPVDTAIKIKYGQTKRPQYDTVKKLADFLRAKPVQAAA